MGTELGHRVVLEGVELRDRPQWRPFAPNGSVFEFGTVRVDRSARSVMRGGETIALTPKEFDLLLALHDRAGDVVPRVELLQEVWGYNSNVVSRTVDTHVAELRRKLEHNPAHPQYIITVRKIGYRFTIG
jgi:DNA-binding response OmpR family regulator